MLALVAAFVLAITMVPALVAILIRGKVAEKDVWLIRKSKKRFLPLLDKAIARPWPFMLGGLAFFLAALPVFGLLGSEFIPSSTKRTSRSRRPACRRSAWNSRLSCSGKSRRR